MRMDATACYRWFYVSHSNNTQKFCCTGNTLHSQTSAQCRFPLQQLRLHLSSRLFGITRCLQNELLHSRGRVWVAQLHVTGLLNSPVILICEYHTCLGRGGAKDYPVSQVAPLISSDHSACVLVPRSGVTQLSFKIYIPSISLGPVAPTLEHSLLILKARSHWPLPPLALPPWRRCLFENLTRSRGLLYAMKAYAEVDV
jgi:hypothetical protein